MLGSHLSIAGSMLHALHEARRLHLDTVQVFTKNQQQWRARPLDPGLVRDWHAEVRRLGWEGRIVAHASYLANLASPDGGLWRRSVDLMTQEIERCAALGIRWLVHHPGAWTTSSPARGIRSIARAYRELFRRTRGADVVCCLEDTVGSGSHLGRTLEELAVIREGIVGATACPERVAFCLDTCHLHAGGYDLSTRAGARVVLEAFDALCGLRHLRVVHLNDSRAPAGSRRDLHAHIGEGTIGRGGLSRSGFAEFVHHPALRPLPQILETPKGRTPAGVSFDTLNLRRLRRLMKSSAESAGPMDDRGRERNNPEDPPVR